MLRRGFKTDAERIVTALMNDLGLARDEPIDPVLVAQRCGYEVHSADSLVPIDTLQRLNQIQDNAFSACTFKLRPDRTAIVYNPLSAKTRRNSDLAHELAHLLLEHELSRVEKLGGLSFLTCDPIQEEEAAWLGGCLLLPRDLLLDDLRAGRSVSEIAEARTVSEQMVQYRINVTGVQRQLRHRRPPSRGR